MEATRRHRHRQPRSKRRCPSLLSSAALFALPLQACIASGSYESESRFSSSTVTHQHGSDISLQSLSPGRRPQHDFTKDNSHQIVETHGLKLHRSFIDRDPIYYIENDSQDININMLAENDGYIMDQSNDPFSSSYHHLQNEWQSPLESLAPLPSLSLEPNNNPSTSSIATSSPLTIQPGYHHSHEIDINQDQQTTQTQMKLKLRSTGTTIAALLARNSTVLILAADTRATDGSTVADKRCEKLHTLARNVWCAGAGTSADVEAMVRRVKFAFWEQGRLLRQEYGGVGNMGINTNTDTDTDADGTNNNEKRGHSHNDDDGTISNEDREVPTASVPAMLHYIRTQLHKSQGNLGVNLLAGGYDHASQRAHLAAIHPHGSMDVVTYAALGSGGLAATGVLESRYPRMGNNGNGNGHGVACCSVEEGVRLAVDAVRAGIENDLGSGSQVDVCVIGEEGVWYRRAIVREEELEWVVVGNDGGSNGDDNVMEDTSLEEQGIRGVNGFGNVPFAIRSKRVVSGSRLNVEQERRIWLDEVVGG